MLPLFAPCHRWGEESPRYRHQRGSSPDSIYNLKSGHCFMKRNENGCRWRKQQIGTTNVPRFLKFTETRPRVCSILLFWRYSFHGGCYDSLMSWVQKLSSQMYCLLSLSISPLAFQSLGPGTHSHLCIMFCGHWGPH